MPNIPVLLCLDVEPDEREVCGSAPGDWAGFEESCRYFRALRPRLAAITGAPVRYSWFFRADPQVAHLYGNAAWALERYSTEIRALLGDGDEIGLHTHAWRWDDRAQGWLADHGDQAWVDHCVRSSFAAYRRALGRHCQSFRFGDHWMSNETMALLEELGVRIDLTLEPGLKPMPALFAGEAYTGSLPDYTAVPRLPYRPSRVDYRRSALFQRRGLWVVPVSTGRVEGPRAARLKRLKRVARACGIERRKRAGGGFSTLNLCLGTTHFQSLTESLLSVMNAPYLAPVVRSEVTIVPHHRENLERNLEYLATHPLASRFRFATSLESLDLFVGRG